MVTRTRHEFYCDQPGCRGRAANTGAPTTAARARARERQVAR